MSIRVVKPMQLGLVHRTFEDGKSPLLAVTVMAFFPFGRRAVLHEVPMWKLAAERLGDSPLDAGMPKTRGELLVVGSAFAPGGSPKPGVPVRVQVGSVDKSSGSSPTGVDLRLYVFGDRRWGMAGPSAPEPFVEMPIVWDRAYGGEGFAKNPVGRGAKEIVDESGAKVRWLPNVEDPEHLVRSPSDSPDPVGLRPLDQTWPERAQHVGTYDAKWQKTRFPWFPEDFHWEFFNVSHPSLRIDGFWRGDELIRVEGMHPDHAVIEGRLPNVAARVFVVKKAEPDKLFSLSTRPDTIVLFPDVEQGVVLFRATLAVEEDDAADVSHIMAAFEDPAEPKPLSHYATVLKNREDREKAILHVLRDTDLLPAWSSKQQAGDDRWTDLIDLVKPEALTQAYFARGVEKRVDEMRKRAAEMGQKFPEHEVPNLKPEPPPSDPEAFAEFYGKMMEDAALAKEMAEKGQEHTERELREQLEARGLDYDAMKEKAKKEGGGPPRAMKADTQLERLRQIVTLRTTAGESTRELEKQLEDPEFVQALRDGEASAYQGYRQASHMMPDPLPIDAGEAAVLRGKVEAAVVAGESMRGWDLTCADLSGLDLAGCDLEEALLEKATLRGTRLSGAKLAGATLAKADLEGADLRKADLTKANLGGATLAGAALDGALLESVVLMNAKLAGASMKRVKLTGNSLFGASGGAVDFTEATFELLHVLDVDLRGSNFTEATIKLTAFVKAKVDGADFSGATLLQSGFIETSGEGAKLEGASIERVIWALGSRFDRSSFVKVSGKMSCLRGCSFEEADFTDAKLESCDLGEANLTKAKLWRTSLKGSFLAKADLKGADARGADMTEVIFQRANVQGADLRGVNFFRADMAKVRGDKGTNLKDAYLVQVRVVPEPERKERLLP